MTEFEKAKAWRKKRGLSVNKLAELTGYGPRAVYWLELGLSAPNSTHRTPASVKPWIWKRYRMMCAGVEAQFNTGRVFDW
ncbi:MAG: helix-turn-helix transcriptional regulator [Patescibacteria group bacterium]|nr:helix-turn-helix transcriptional regulator [Patescibacteria group bacterium]